MILGAKQLCYLLVNTLRGKALTLVRSAEKHHGIEVKSEYQPSQLDDTQQCSWDSCDLVGTLELTEWERRIQEYEGECLETFSDGMKIAVLASHAPESIRNVVRLAAGPAGGKYRLVRQNMSEFLQFGRVFDKDGRGVKSSEPSSASATPMDVDAVGKGKGKDASCADVPATQQKTASLVKPRARPRARAKRRTPRLTRTVPPSLKVSVATVARKVTSGQNAGSVWQKRQTRMSTPLEKHRRRQRWRQWKKHK